MSFAAFQSNAFQNNAFQIGAQPSSPSPGSGFGPNIGQLGSAEHLQRYSIRESNQGRWRQHLAALERGKKEKQRLEAIAKIEAAVNAIIAPLGPASTIEEIGAALDALRGIADVERKLEVESELRSMIGRLEETMRLAAIEAIRRDEEDVAIILLNSI